MNIEYEVKITYKDEIKSLFKFLHTEFILSNFDQDCMLKEILYHCAKKTLPKLKQFGKSCTLKFSPGESSAICFLYDNVLLKEIDYTNPYHVAIMGIRNELIRQSMNYKAQFETYNTTQ